MGKAPTPGLQDELDGKPPKGADGPMLCVSDGDTTHEVQVARLTARQVRRLRDETGYSLVDLLSAGTLDIDVAAAIVWLSGVQAGRDESFDSVSDSLTVGGILDGIPDPADKVEEPGDPKE